MGDLMPSRRKMQIGLTLLTAVAAPAMIIMPAIAAPAHPATGTGQFKTWPEAQRAAGYALMKPGTTYGLRAVGRILVDKCFNHVKKRVVTVAYGSLLHRALGLVQDNASGACQGTIVGTKLGTYKIHGIKAHMYGYCDLNGAPPCTWTDIELWLVWKDKTHYFTASSHDFSRYKLWLFASKLKKA